MKKQLPNILTLALVIASILLSWQWVWGVLFLLWIWPSFYTGETHLLTPVRRKENAILFWIIQLLWVLLSLALIAQDFVK